MRYSRRKGNFSVNTDPKLLNLDFIHEFLSKSYWARDRSKETITKSLEHSLCFGLYNGETQIGFARVVTDYGTFAYLFDVFVDEKFRGNKLGKWMMETVLEHPELLEVNWMLKTRDAQAFYQKLGFQEIEKPERYLEKKPIPPSMKWD
jgi:ribosomal protein S18 acetylase RimI-like enzyme